MLIFGLLLTLLSFQSHAHREIISQIYQIDNGIKKSDETLVLLANGHVLKISIQDKKKLPTISNEKSFNEWYQFKLDKNRFIKSMKKIPSPKIDLKFSNPMEMRFQDYIPTTIKTHSLARRYFAEARYNPKESQCFNRAMVWTYEWWRNHEIRSNKIFIFFTRNYIRKYNFEWWFHVAPYVHVLKEGKVVERVMDIKYTSGPLQIPSWTNIFMKNNAKCPVITKYSEYADFPYEYDCFIQRTNMFTYQPADLQMYEAWGYSKTNFNFNEVQAAYLEAFDEDI
jgi:hypothetical protein